MERRIPRVRVTTNAVCTTHPASPLRGGGSPRQRRDGEVPSGQLPTPWCEKPPRRARRLGAPFLRTPRLRRAVLSDWLPAFCNDPSVTACGRASSPQRGAGLAAARLPASRRMTNEKGAQCAPLRKRMGAAPRRAAQVQPLAGRPPFIPSSSAKAGTARQQPPSPPRCPAP